VQLQADVVDRDRRPIAGRAADGDLEFARQEGEFGVEGGPLAHQLAPGPRVLDLVHRDPGELVGGDVAHAIAAGLDGMHLDLGEFGEDVRDFFEPGPVELDVLAGGEVGIALVVVTGDVCQPAQLCRGQQAIGHADPQHGCHALDIEPILQTQGTKLVVGQFAGQIALGLMPELADPFAYQGPVPLIVTVHGDAALAFQSRTSMVAVGQSGVKN
jgi:hypothetical protein